MNHGVFKRGFRAQKRVVSVCKSTHFGWFWGANRPFSGAFGRYLMYRITLSCGYVVEHATYQEAWEWLQEDDGCIVEEEECTED